MTKPLSGLRVVEMTLAGAGPFAGATLAALGAEVIKLERPQGDTSLGVPPYIKGLAHLYLAVNTGKRSIIVDLRDAADRAVVYKLIAGADVFLQNMRVGVAERLGLGPADIAAIKPDIVYTSISGYGEEGDLARDACNDPTMQAFSGFASLNGRAGENSELFRTYAHLDVTSASYAVLGTLAGLLRRRRTGAGSRAHVSLLSGALGVAGLRVAEFRETGKPPELRGSAANETAPNRVFQGSDGVWFTVGVVRSEQWEKLCRSIGLPVLLGEPQYRTNQARLANAKPLETLLQARFKTAPAGEWIEKLRRAGVPSGPVYLDDFEAIRHDPQTLAACCFSTVVSEKRGEMFIGTPPWRFDGKIMSTTAAPERDNSGPTLREHVALLPDPPRRSLPDGSDTAPLDGIRVLELVGGVAGPYAGKLLRDLGAAVTKVEGPGGDPSRDYAPRKDGVSVAFEYLNAGKSVMSTPAEDVLLTLLAESDAVILDREERWFDQSLLDRARELNPSLVLCRTSGYGERGPLRDLPASELVLQGMAGYLGSLGRKGDEPIRMGADPAGMNTGTAIAQAVIASLSDGTIRDAEVSALGMLIFIKTITWVSWSNPDEAYGFANDHVRRGRDHGYTTKDRRVYVATGRGNTEDWAKFLIGVGLEEYVTEPQIGEGGYLVLGTGVHAERWRDVFDQAFSRFTAAEITELSRSLGGKPSAIFTLDETLAHPQTAAANALDEHGLPRPVTVRPLVEK
jgi:CoA:oxalate CoA-transferase